MTFPPPPEEFRKSDEKWLAELRRACRNAPAHVSCDQVGHLAKLMSVGRKCWPW